MNLFNKNPVERRIRHKKIDKKNAMLLKPKAVSQKTANRLLLAFILLMVGLCALSILSNSLRALGLGNQPKVIQSKQRDSRNISNRVGLFMTDFLNSYFSDNTTENQEKLLSFYGAGIDVKNTSQSLESRLTGATLIEITDNLATYRVAYSVKVDEDWQDNVGVIAIPYGAKGNTYYVSDLPYFIDEDSYVAKKVKNNYRLAMQSNPEDFKKEKQYLEAFFKAYVTGDRTQLLPFSKTVKPVLGYAYDSMDYTYFVKKSGRILAAVQVTFVDGLGLAHQENFTLTLSKDKSKETYFVDEMKHGISSEIKKEMK